jgi:DNA-binding response OmpR family regulator
MEVLRGPALDLAILDYSLPDGTALELLQAAGAAQPQAKIVVLTAYPSPTLEAEARRRGAARFLIKPIELGELRALLEGLLARPDGG